MKLDKYQNLWTFKLILLVMCHLVGTINIVAVLALAPIISADFQLNAIDFGFLISAYYGGQAIWSMPSGVLVDRYGVAKVLVFSHIIMASAALLLGLAEGYRLSLFSLFLMGVGYSMTNPGTGRAVLVWFVPELRGTAMGIKQVGVPLGGIIASSALSLASIIQWQSMMLGAGGLIFLNGVFCLFLFKGDRTVDQLRASPFVNLKEVIRMPQLQINALLNGLINIGQINFFSFLTLYLREVAFASLPMASFAIGFAQTTSAFGRIFWGVICDKWFIGRRRVLMGLLTGGASVLLFSMVWVNPGWGFWLGLTLAGLLGFSIASYAPIALAMTLEMVEPRLSGSALGCSMTGVFIGGMIGPPVFGLVIDLSGSFETGWVFTSVATCVGVLILTFCFKEGIQK